MQIKWKRNLLIVACIFLTVVFVYSSFFFTAYVPTDSMYPLIPAKSLILVRTGGDKPDINSVVVFYEEHQSKSLVKRIIGKEGDTIVLSEGKVFRNGELLEETYVKNIDKEYSGEFQVPKGKYFVLGDNRADSYDSRYLPGTFIDEECIEGKVLLLIFPEFRKITNTV